VHYCIRLCLGTVHYSCPIKEDQNFLPKTQQRWKKEKISRKRRVQGLSKREIQDLPGKIDTYHEGSQGKERLVVAWKSFLRRTLPPKEKVFDVPCKQKHVLNNFNKVKENLK
jgi:hypothetical protein